MNQFEDAIADILMVLSEVSIGDFESKVPIPDEEDTAMGALCLGINSMIDALREKSLEAEASKRELEGKLEMINKQAKAILELSTPIMEIWDDILVLPIIGIVDTKRSLEIMSNLLESIVEHQSKCVIIDITGVEIVDTKTADYLIKVVRAASLLGTRCVLTGLRPSVAQVLVDIGVDLAEVTTLRNLKEGLRNCLSYLKAAKSEVEELAV